jgi:esterase/lipase superfamily enzyme
VRVFYGTDRNRTGAKEWAKYYGAGRGKLEMGTCEIGIPKTHQRGQLESPSWWRLEFSEDPTRHVMLRRVEPLGEGKFYEQYQSALGEAKTRDVFVFIHGYNVTFADAARRTAQLTYDLGFPGVPVFYSWPSQGSLTPIGYTTDETNVEWTEPHLKQFLKGLATQPGGARIHLVAHSMGNRALTKVMRALAAESDTPLFSEVILTAPDIDAAVFEEQLAPAIQKIARRVTLYASSNDNALIFSKGVHGYPRAGESGPTIIVTPGIDTIDASGIDTSLLGHSYYAEMQVVLKDMNDLLTGDKAPGERSLREQIKGAGKYWILAAVGMTPDAPGAPPGWRFGRVYPFLIIFAVVAVGLAVWLVLRGRRRTT